MTAHHTSGGHRQRDAVLELFATRLALTGGHQTMTEHGGANDVPKALQDARRFRHVLDLVPAY